MKYPNLFVLVILLVCVIACEERDDDNSYNQINFINLPTNDPQGLAYDGNYLWYGDDSLNCLFKISPNENILDTINPKRNNIKGFEFYHDRILFIGNSDISSDGLKYSFIYEITEKGEIIDSIFIGSVLNPEESMFFGLTIMDSIIYISSDAGRSSSLSLINLEDKQGIFSKYQSLAGLTIKNDTLYGIDRSHIYVDRIVSFDGDYNIIEEKAMELNFRATDLAYVDDHFWVCDRQARRLVRIQ